MTFSDDLIATMVKRQHTDVGRRMDSEGDNSDEIDIKEVFEANFGRREKFKTPSFKRMSTDI
jgi:hypothetical protein